MKRTSLIVSVAAIFLVLSFPVIKWLSIDIDDTKVEPGILLVEGWLPERYSTDVANAFLNHNHERIITTGLNFEEQFILYENSFLVFYTEGLLEAEGDSTVRIDIAARGSLGNDMRSRFNVWVDDSLHASFVVEKEAAKYSAVTEILSTEIDSVTIQFTNDTLLGKIDRNLIIESLEINGHPFIPFRNSVRLDKGRWDGKLVDTVFAWSYAEQFAQHLFDQGISSASIIPLPGKFSKRNRTLGSVRPVYEWLYAYESEVPGITLVTMKGHARRSFYIYRNLIERDIEIGIMAVPGSNNKSPVVRISALARELIAFMYYYYVAVPVEKVKRKISG